MLNKILLSCVVLFTSVFLSGCKKESVFKFTKKPQVIIDAKVAGNHSIHLFKDTVYVLAVNLVRDSGETLSIDAGTLVKVNNLLSITINKGGKLNAAGSQADPIIFTSSNFQGTQGFSISSGNWDGIQIYGDETDDGSGTLSYVRIEFAGLYNSSLLLSHVSNRTILNNIQVSYSFNTTSFDLDGGNCNLSNAISYFSAGTDFFIRDGYKGLMQNILAYRGPFYAVRGPAFGAVYIKDQFTSPIISNMTVIGPDSSYGISPNYLAGGDSKRAALITTDNCVFHIRNSAFINFPLKTYLLDNYNSADSLDKGLSDLSHSIFYNTDSSKVFYLKDGVYPPYGSTDMRNFLLSASFDNEIYLDRTQFMLTNPYNYYDGIPDPSPKTGSPLLTGADFNSPFYENSFFNKVDYRGAIGNINWSTEWTNFQPLKTDYNY